MRFLTVPPSSPAVWEAILSRPDLFGVIITPKSTRSLRAIAEWPLFSVDNGCYSQGESFDPWRYLSFLRKLQPLNSHCLFATSPDVVADALATEWMSWRIGPLMRGMNYSVALACQDGIEDMCLDSIWCHFDVAMIAGSTEWKLSQCALDVAREAKKHGLGVHAARVNSWKRLQHFAEVADTADGTCLAIAPDTNLRKLTSWLEEIQSQTSMLNASRQPVEPDLDALVRRRQRMLDVTAADDDSVWDSLGPGLLPPRPTLRMRQAPSLPTATIQHALFGSGVDAATETA